MKVLHLPYNVSSQISIYVRALQDIGVDARGIVFADHPYLDNDGIEVFSFNQKFQVKYISSIVSLARTMRKIIPLIHWADIVHWRWGKLDRNLKWIVRYLGFIKKPCLIDFCGSDIRNCENACKNNPFLCSALREEDNLHKPSMLSLSESLERQAFFSKNGFDCVIRKPELSLHIDKNYFPKPYYVMSPLILKDYLPNYPDPNNHRPLVVHCPSKQSTKGTKYINEVVERLKKIYDFEFKILHGISHKELLAVMRSCDIVLDQFTLGDYGIISTEAMAMGKPSVCWLRPEILSLLPAEIPIVNADLNNLEEVLGKLIKEPHLRYEIGLQSRKYIEKHHDSHKCAQDVLNVYEQILDKRKNKG